MSKKVIFMIGEIHRDPAAAALIKQTIDRLNLHKTPTGLYCEVATNITPKDYYNNLLEAIPIAERLSKTFFHNEFISKSPLRLPFVPLEKQVVLKEKISSVIESEELLCQIYTSLIRLPTYKQELPLYKEIINSNITFKGIDDLISFNEKDILGRDKAMAKNIYDHITGEDNTLEVIICEVGILHIHRLTALFEKIIDESPIKTNIKLFPMMIHSRYVEDEILYDKKLIEKYKEESLPELGSFYEKTPVLDILVEENPTTGSFSSDEFNNLVGDLITYLNDLS